jgi:hypothetical protein
MDDDECGAVGGMSDKENLSTRWKPAPVPPCPPQIPHDLTFDSNPGRRLGKPATNLLSYGTSTARHYFTQVLRFVWNVGTDVPDMASHPGRRLSRYRRENLRPYCHLLSDCGRVWDWGHSFSSWLHLTDLVSSVSLLGNGFIGWRSSASGLTSLQGGYNQVPTSRSGRWLQLLSSTELNWSSSDFSCQFPAGSRAGPSYFATNGQSASSWCRGLLLVLMTRV